MLPQCSECGILIQANERVCFEVQGRFKEIGSSVAWAVQKNEFEYVPGTIRHVRCEED